MMADQPSVEFAALSETNDWLSLLSEEERTRAAGIANPTVRARFETGRGLRRKMLSKVTGFPVTDLTFVESDEGKPCVLNAAGWDFNVSHSGDYVAVAVGQGQVGVDLEQFRLVREMESIVDRYFHPDEAAEWRSLAPGLREEAFFVLWSAREASMKCVGLGLARGSSVTRVDPLIVTGNATFACVGDARVEVRRVEAPRGYVAMVAQAVA